MKTHFIERISWESCFPKIIFVYFSKWVYSVCNDSRVCLHLILLPSSLRIMSWRKQKIRSMKNHLKSYYCIQPKRLRHGCCRSEIAVKQIFNLDHRLYTLQKHVVCKSQVDIGHTSTEISLNFASFTGFF